MYLVANWFNLADEACEDALYDIPAFRHICRIDLGRVPGATILLKFRHLLEQHEIGDALFAKVGEMLLANGMKLSGGTIVDATLIAAPPSTKNKDHGRDPEMHQSKKANLWYFGMKLHIGADSRSGLVHSASVTAGNVHDSHELATCCMAMRLGCTATALIGARSSANGSRNLRPRPRASPTSGPTGTGR